MLSAWNEEIAGAAGGISGTLLGYPLDNIKTRMQVKNYGSVAETVRYITENEGFMGFYRGIMSPLLALTILNSVNFSSYFYFRKSVLSDTDRQIELVNEGKVQTLTSFTPAIFLAGAAVGPVASIISTPFELLKTQLQIDKSHGTTLRALSSILRQHGVAALFRGHTVNTFRETLFLGIYFFVYEHSRGAFERFFPASFAIPLAGGISGSMGWFLSFPFDSIKSNKQGTPLSVQPQSSRAIFTRLVQTKGVKGLYAGLAPSISRAFLVSATRFSAYEFVMHKLNLAGAPRE